MLPLAAALERYSRHPLAAAVVEEAERAGPVPDAAEVREPPGAGLRGVVEGKAVRVTGRNAVTTQNPAIAGELPPPAAGMECVALVFDAYLPADAFREGLPSDQASRVG